MWFPVEKLAPVEKPKRKSKAKAKAKLLAEAPEEEDEEETPKHLSHSSFSRVLRYSHGDTHEHVVANSRATAAETSRASGANGAIAGRGSGVTDFGASGVAGQPAAG